MVFWPPITCPAVKWAVYDAQLYNIGTFQGWLYPSRVISTLGSVEISEINANLETLRFLYMKTFLSTLTSKYVSYLHQHLNGLLYTTLHPRVISWITGVEKVRHEISLDELIFLRYAWIIEENGQSAFQRLHISRFMTTEIELRIMTSNL
jgi:hypothetical protein